MNATNKHKDLAAESREIFNRDVSETGSYLYTSADWLAASVAHARISEAMCAACDISGKRVLDICCGDGAYTVEWFRRAGPSELIGLDMADVAVKAANEKFAAHAPRLRFEEGNAYDLSRYEDNSFDVSIIRAALHHMETPQVAVREALRVAPTLVILEPNGHSPALKVIEKVSPYHRAHHEMSYSHRALRKMVEDAGGRVDFTELIGFVPHTCPNALVKVFKALEPLIEKSPVVRHLACAQVLMVAHRV